MTTAKRPDESFELCPQGTFQAICIGEYDLGLQQTNFVDRNTGEKKYAHQVLLRWELDVRYQSGALANKRFCLVKKYTNSLSEKATLYKDLKAWRGRDFTDEEFQGFDLSRLVGKPCLISVVHSADGKYANIGSISPLMAGMIPIVQESDKEVPGFILEMQKRQLRRNPATQAREEARQEVDHDGVPF